MASNDEQSGTVERTLRAIVRRTLAVAAVFSRAAGGLKGLVRNTRVEQELDAELRAFIEASAEDKVRAGMSPEAAARAVRIESGSTAAVKDYVRDVGWESLLESVWQDVRYALRTLRRSPGFTSVAVLTLALGIGATTAIFSLLEAVIVRSLPVKNPEELVVVSGGGLSPVFQAFRKHTNIFTDLFASSGVSALDVGVRGGLPERTDVSLVSGGYFSTLGVQAVVGRVFTADDDRIPGEHPFAVASYGCWQRRFGGDPAVAGSVIRISGTPITIIGVAPRGFFGEEVGKAPDLWVPLTMWGQIVPGRNLLQSPGTGWLRLIGRVRPGVARAGVQPELTHTLQQVLTGIFGPTPPEDVRRDIASATVTFESAGRGVSSLRARFARPLQLLTGAAALVLFIACANIANLLLARATARRREIDVRLALGMRRARLVRQLLTESLVLASAGGAAGVAVAWMGREALLRLISADGSRLPLAVALDARLFAFVAVISLTTGIGFGLAPAWRSARASLGSSLIARRDAGASRQRLSSILIAGQVAVSLVLLMGAGLFLRTVANLRDVDLGFAPERLLVVDVNSQAAGYTGTRAVALGRRLLDAVEAVPGVSSVSLSEDALLMGRDSTTNVMRPRDFVAGPEGFPRTHWDVVGPRYFSTIRAPLVSGRDFSGRDDAGSPLVIAINQEMARLFFGGADPIGRTLLWGEGNEAKEFEIVAVARDVKQSGPRDEPEPRFYLPYFQLPAARSNWTLASTRLLVRTATDPAALAPSLRELIPSIDPKLSVAGLDTGPELVARTLVQERLIAVLLSAFGALAIGLACLGLYGLIAYHAVQRTGEIGIRMALGAQRGDVLWMMLRRALLWIAAGVAIGVPLALTASRVAQRLLFGLSATDPGTLAGATLVMTAMGLIAGYIPARLAASVDPLAALRHD